MTPADPWAAVSAARLPAGAVGALGPVRDRPDVRVHVSGAVAWVRWPAGQPDVVRCLLPVAGVEFFVQRGGAWFPFGRRVPTADRPPDGEGVSVAAAVFPARLHPIPPDDEARRPLALTVVRGGGPQPVTALACPVADLTAWADTATSAEIEAVTAARSGPRAVLRGLTLPAIPSAVRYWGTDFLVPVGYRPDPDLPPAALRAAVGATAGELVLLDAAGVTVIPAAAFAKLTRASVRLGLRPEAVP